MFNDQDTIYDFLAQRRIALIGVSRKDKHFSRMLFKELIERRYQVCAVNPNAEHIDGFPCFNSITDVMKTDFGDTPVGGAIIIAAPDNFDQIADECLESGVKRIWLYGIMGNAPKHHEIIDKCRRANISIISDLCPFMFLPQTGLIHRLHAGFLKLTGKYPKKST
jgi:predicted CoA-binding protein